MEALVLIGGFLLIGALGYYAAGRLDHFLDEGGISPYWDAEDEAAAKKEAKEAAKNAKKTGGRGRGLPGS